jgi:hypothetical protein
LTWYPSLESRGEGGDANETEESSVEGKTRSAVLLVFVAVGAIDVARVGGVAVGVLVCVLVVGRAAEGALDLSVASLRLGSNLGERLARRPDIGGTGDVKGTLDILERGKLDPKNVMLVIERHEIHIYMGSLTR